ncbi:hypothetical protein AALP_AAs60350U000200 [Arabis alpina]|uniref:Uncharacterized protein n=1 Tax=Arabis alpina TaxID=50452 RepID=A0A087G381_ARAAL|nr:hypothetical protein AALP_AAs60350U000200 [Arabis alpina]
MTLIPEFPSKDGHFEDRFFFVELSEKTVEADCIGLVKTRWERRVKPLLPEVSKEFVTAMHDELSSGNGNWRKSFSRKRIERALSTEIIPGKILGQGRVRVSSREQAALEVAAKAAGLSSTSAPRAVVPMTSTPTALSTRLSLLFDRLVGDYDEDIRFRDSELRMAREANAVLQSRLDEFAKQNKVLERDALSVQKIKKDCDDKLTKLKSRCTKAEGEIVQLRDELSSASDLQHTRIGEAVAGLLVEIGGNVQNDMLNLAEIDANLELIGLLQGSEPLDLQTKVKALRERRHPIYDARDVFADLLASVRRVLEIPVVSVGAAVASVAIDDDVEVIDEDDVEVTDDDEDIEE